MHINIVSGKISLFFKKDFKKKFTIFLLKPILITALFLVDFFLLPETIVNDSISYVSFINTPQTSQDNSVRANKSIGYKYTTARDLKFSTIETKIESRNIKLTVSPLFKTVKTVITPNNISVALASGFNGFNKFLLILFNSIMLVSIVYVNLAKEITENARLNLIFFNLFIITVWICALILI